MQNHTLKFYLRKDKENKLGLLPIYMRLTLGRDNVKATSTRHYVHKLQWDERKECVINHPLAGDINLDLVNRKKAVLSRIVDARVQGKTVNTSIIKSSDALHDVFAFHTKYIKTMGAHLSDARKRTLHHLIKKLKAYHGSEILPFNEVNSDYLYAFAKWMEEGGIKAKIKSNGNVDNTISIYMQAFKSLFNANRKNIAHYPFGKGEYVVPKIESGDKEWLSIEELNRWMDNIESLPDEDMRFIGVWFLFGCYTGLRKSDWRRFDHATKIRRGTLILRTRKNGELVVVPIHPKLKTVLEWTKKYPAAGKWFYDEHINKVARFNGINKYLTSHCARKTFAVTICLDRGITSETAADLMGIELQTFLDDYASLTDVKTRHETSSAWANL